MDISSEPAGIGVVDTRGRLIPRCSYTWRSPCSVIRWLSLDAQGGAGRCCRRWHGTERKDRGGTPPPGRAAASIELGRSAAVDVRIVGREHAGRVVLPDPHVLVVVDELARRVPGHRAIEGLAEDGGP